MNLTNARTNFDTTTGDHRGVSGKVSGLVPFGVVEVTARRTQAVVERVHGCVW